ncbi:endonuclease/exonuclease/phosphatase family protein [Patiriisocius marinistellae]|uniref:endonuclease/exonuclease/phosphatase family protein n=1 Tax=Patiriisocius marinistellae TaxID=2494560 RepID=UPI001F1EB7ED|nr:endonuclease/exonuclease/phosphatase family protein [Patiriisocius marinistellae]
MSTAVLILAYFSFNTFYKFSSETETSQHEHKLSVLSYNVRLFNAYEKEDNNSQKFITKLISEENPDVICFQEYYRETEITLEGYPHRYIHFKNDKVHFGHAIFSKYPLVYEGAFDFPQTLNNTLYANVVKGGDTLRLYNVHLKSMSVQPTVDYLQQENKTKLFKRMTSAFEKQQEQVEAILKHKEQSPHPVVVAGDFNNTAFSYIYRKMQKGMKDAYVESGYGLGTTFKFDSYPMRIDYIFTSEMVDVLEFKTKEETFSDHYPIKATVGWDSN